jgi:4-amino-4-deoxy-L-arabinose transferase-like glycosyltransferase
MTKMTGMPEPFGPAKVLALLTCLSLVMRFFSFFPSVIDHDESTYIVIADALREGKVYLRDVIDTKPIGIFALFAIFQTLFGKSIIVIRIITALWMALTGWMLYLAHRQLIKDSSEVTFNGAPIATGIIYVFALSIFTTFGVSPNTEHFFALFSATALVLILRYESWIWFLIAGLLLGIGFIIKYVVLFDAVALGLFYVWLQITKEKKWGYWLARGILMAIGFLVPITLVWMFYRHLGMEDTFLFYTFEVSHKYFVKPPWYSYWIFLLQGLLHMAPVTILFIYCSVHWRTIGLRLPLLAWGWSALVVFIILLPGKPFLHYFFQLMLPFSLLAGSFFDPRRSPGKAFAWICNPRIGFTILVLGILINVVLQKKDYFDPRDNPKEIAAYLNTRLHPGDIIYTVDGPHIIYHLTGTESPTPYIHPSLIWHDENNQVLGISRVEELNKIMAQNPRFIITQNYPLPTFLMKPALEKSYQQVMAFGKRLVVYEKK